MDVCRMETRTSRVSAVGAAVEDMGHAVQQASAMCVHVILECSSSKMELKFRCCQSK